jgi:hypothetical protein
MYIKTNVGKVLEVFGCVMGLKQGLLGNPEPSPGFICWNGEQWEIIPGEFCRPCEKPLVSLSDAKTVD